MLEISSDVWEISKNQRGLIFWLWISPCVCIHVCFSAFPSWWNPICHMLCCLRLSHFLLTYFQDCFASSRVHKLYTVCAACQLSVVSCIIRCMARSPDSSHNLPYITCYHNEHERYHFVSACPMILHLSHCWLDSSSLRVRAYLEAARHSSKLVS